jgi:hypothetical protein
LASGDLGDIQFDPKNADTVYVASVVTWRSTNFGNTWTAFRGAPGGDDYQNIWINPSNNDIMGISSDQGAIITLNGGRSWSSWYNQSTAQLYHVSADNAFPYRYAAASRRAVPRAFPAAATTARYKSGTPVAAENTGMSSPIHLIRHCLRGKLTGLTEEQVRHRTYCQKRFEARTFDDQDAADRFSPVNKNPYFSGNTLWKTSDGGNNWRRSVLTLREKPGIFRQVLEI